MILPAGNGSCLIKSPAGQGLENISDFPGSGIELILRLMDIFQIVSVRAADHIAAVEVRMLSADPVQIFKRVELCAGKGAAGRNKTKV